MARNLRLQGTTRSAYRKFSAARGWRAILVNQPAQPSIPGSPLPTSGRSRGHMTQPLQLDQRPRTTSGEVGLLAFCQAPCRPDEVRQARLPRLHPVLVYSVAVTHQDASPVV